MAPVAIACGCVTVETGKDKWILKMNHHPCGWALHPEGGHMKRAILIVLDSVGIGELPDADRYGDVGSKDRKSVV